VTPAAVPQQDVAASGDAQVAPAADQQPSGAGSAYTQVAVTPAQNSSLEVYEPDAVKL
jgi:hypothetical protein